MTKIIVQIEEAICAQCVAGKQEYQTENGNCHKAALDITCNKQLGLSQVKFITNAMEIRQQISKSAFYEN